MAKAKIQYKEAWKPGKSLKVGDLMQVKGSHGGNHMGRIERLTSCSEQYGPDTHEYTIATVSQALPIIVKPEGRYIVYVPAFLKDHVG